MSNYDNDSEMKEVMQNFNKETEQRFYEYDKHMIKNRQKLAVKVEKICLKCGGILVKKVSQLILIGGTTLYAISV
ncbi:hypothetical protein PFAG_02229 [Plasmodium falciparum Santa Lucia]|uniref:Uncharacterized protein n=5 Tax=Plasmodium falciparum TaxID=5833 RepID=W4IQS9_PLAFP|nr:hypothetical protein PFFVO_02279 [Plasmodium falciparum Vietnam Oak-Knoll (FVO)]ETW31569.1 hypothetical protein PFFCH_00988 [Plasmodium falciparum FCH/4]ETW49750.1 hypothetical protein PFMALIP_02284 [Plasmodium falciparum MaliPS096_E11]ETW52328.1 hypothetical protein PFUGPA_05335 [Plasmodium falciparum Palo Alto/Uganda]EUT87406.1 hypothetical protein PFAG_02229 [Plasmodium falciparum Santa Lucia]